MAGEKPDWKHHRRPRGVPPGASGRVLCDEAGGGGRAAGDGRGHSGLVLCPGHAAVLQTGDPEGGDSLRSGPTRLPARHPRGHVHRGGPCPHRRARGPVRRARLEAHHPGVQLGRGVENNLHREVHPQGGQGAHVGGGKV